MLASLIVALLASSAAPTPLYAVYQAQWHFTPITTTVVFGVYALAVLASLLTLGKLSDHIGRRPVLLTALAVHAGSLVIFATATGVPALLGARMVQGLSTGAALGAIGAAMLDMNRELGTFANAVAPGMGSATGAILSALAVRFLPDPTHLIYLALIGVLALQAAAIIAMRETVSPAPGALASLRPEVTLPRGLRAPVLTAVPVLFAVWALAGLYGALGPALVHTLTGSDNVVLGALSLFVLAGSAVVATIVLRRAAARTVMLVGILALITGVAVTVTACDPGVRGGLLRRRFAIAGPAGVRQRLPGRHPPRGTAGRAARAGRPWSSLLYVVSYLGLGAPAAPAGFGVVHGGRTDRHRPLLRRRGNRAGRAGPVRPAEERARPRRGACRRPGPGHTIDKSVSGRWPSPWLSRKRPPPKAPGGWGPPPQAARLAASSLPEPAESGRRHAERLASRGQRTVLQRGRAHGRHRPHHRAGRRGQGLAVQHVRQQGRAGPCLPGDPPRQRHPAHHAGGGALRHPARAPAGRVRGPGAELFALPDYRGCAFARASAESHPGDLAEQAAEAYRRWVRALLTELAARAGVPEPEVLARQLHLLYDGSGQSARMDHDPAAAAAARAAAATLLDAALG